MILKLYNTFDDRRKVNKSLQYVGQLRINEKMDKNNLYPEILLKKGNKLEFNYIYIEDFEKYYFCNNFTQEKGFLKVSCSIDVLMTYKNAIKNIYCLVERQEFEYSPYIIDTELITRCDKTVITNNIGNVGISGGNYQYYLCVNGGGAGGN